MNTARLMEDLTASLNGHSEKIHTNYLDASVALTCNLITNAISGDLADENLIAFLDGEFLTNLLKRRFLVSSLGHDIPLLLQGMHDLRTDGSSRPVGDVLRTCLLDFYQGALPLGPWDDILVENNLRYANASNLLTAIRPDLSDLITNDKQRMAWLIKHGFQEIPLYRSSIRQYFLEAITHKAVRLQSGTVGFAFEQISSSTPPQNSDLFIQELGFKRWINLRGAMLIYKKTALEGRVNDMRWLQGCTTLALRNSVLGPQGKVTLSIGALGKPESFVITVDSTDKTQIKEIRFSGVNSILFEFRIQRWVDTVRITIESTGNYIADLGVA